jgi:peptide chain release factor 1
VVSLFRAYQQAEHERVAAEEMLGDTDPEIRQMGQEELTDVQARLEKLEQQGH